MGLTNKRLFLQELRGTLTTTLHHGSGLAFSRNLHGLGNNRLFVSHRVLYRLPFSLFKLSPVCLPARSFVIKPKEQRPSSTCSTLKEVYHNSRQIPTLAAEELLSLAQHTLAPCPVVVLGNTATPSILAEGTT